LLGGPMRAIPGCGEITLFVSGFQADDDEYFAKRKKSIPSEFFNDKNTKSVEFNMEDALRHFQSTSTKVNELLSAGIERWNEKTGSNLKLNTKNCVADYLPTDDGVVCLVSGGKGLEVSSNINRKLKMIPYSFFERDVII